MTNDLILAIDQGTTSSRALIFDKRLRIMAESQKDFPQHYPKSGWVEHAPEDLWQSCLSTAKTVLGEVGAQRVCAVGVTNQRETLIVWNKITGKAVYNAIVWQDRRTDDYCQQLKKLGHEANITAKTGLLLDPYFSASKIRWVLDHIDQGQLRAEAGELLCGTVDSFLIWRLTSGQHHLTDATNASRTLLFNIHSGQWDSELLELFTIPAIMLPDVKDCTDDFGETDPKWFGCSIPIRGVVGDQQAAAIGQACLAPGDIKVTFGTGGFALLNTGTEAIASKNRMLTTIAYSLNGQRHYALEGSVFIAGAVVQWLRDGLEIIDSAEQTETLAKSADNRSNNSEHDLIFIPAFTGLGAPYWQADVRGALFGLTRDTSRADIVHAALQSVVFQSQDLFIAMQQDYQGLAFNTLKVDGGMSNNDWLMQSMADQLNMTLERPANTETTVLGAALLAAVGAGWWPDLTSASQNWMCKQRFSPSHNPARSKVRYGAWQTAIRKLLS